MLTLELQNISKFYGSYLALKEMDLKFEPGVTLIIGQNGAGKSTLLKIISGMIKPSSGVVLKSGKIGILPEKAPLYLNMTVREYLKLVMKINQIPYNDAPLYFCKLNELANWPIGYLSKGQKQKVALMQALVGDPEILVLDEPLIGLDFVTISELKQLISKLKEKIIIISTHQILELENLANTTILLKNGEIIERSKGLFQEITVMDLSPFSDKLLTVFTSKFGISPKVSKNKYYRLECQMTDEMRQKVIKFFIEENVGIKSIYPKESSLEYLFNT